MQVGRLRIDPVVDANVEVDPARLFSGLGAADWAVHADLLTPEGRLAMSVGGYLVRGSGDRVVLVDTGLGPPHEVRMPDGSSGGHHAGLLLESLAGLGLEPADVSDVVLTHLHHDHSGWVAVDGRPVFPRATYHCARADWDWFTADADRGFGAPDRACLAAISDRMSFWEGDATVLTGVDVRPAPGHTPGSSVVVLSSGADRALLLGDVVHCPAQLLASEWEGLHDVDPDLARRTRESLAVELEESATPVAAAHFPGLAFGRVLAAEGRRLFTFGA